LSPLTAGAADQVVTLMLRKPEVSFWDLSICLSSERFSGCHTQQSHLPKTALDRWACPPQIAASGTMVPSEIKGALALRGVTFSYPSRPAVQVLNGLDLDIRVGETVALVGPSGGGKSSIVSTHDTGAARLGSG